MTVFVLSREVEKKKKRKEKSERHIKNVLGTILFT
jgi:hypothetical protein